MRFDVVLALYQRCSFLTIRGNAKTFTSWNERQNWLHVFLYV